MGGLPSSPFRLVPVVYVMHSDPLSFVKSNFQSLIISTCTIHLSHVFPLQKLGEKIITYNNILSLIMPFVSLLALSIRVHSMYRASIIMLGADINFVVACVRGAL